ncbi:MAG: GyrI-like domain-containing protein [Bacteroidales bacterium]|nr:GyrI-like domain-containing protein [Bacteroidales bacterium]
MKKKILFLPFTIMIILIFFGCGFTLYSQSKIEVKSVQPMSALVIKAEVPTAEIGPKMGELYGMLFNYLTELEMQPSGPPFSVYYEFDPQGNTVFEAGVPLDDVVEGEGDILYKDFPAMKVVSTLYTGSYENMMPVYEDLEAYLKENKLESNNIVWEIYLTDPNEVGPEENQTIIYYQIK